MNSRRCRTINVDKRWIWSVVFFAGMVLVPCMAQGQNLSALLRGTGSRIRITDVGPNGGPEGGPSNANANIDAYRVFPTNEITVEAWVYPLFIEEERRDIVRRPVSRTTEDNTYSLSIENGKACFHISTGDEVPEIAEVWSTIDLPLFEWTHLAGTYNGTNLTLYINGGDVLMAVRW
jgi:hypothetical protein